MSRSRHLLSSFQFEIVSLRRTWFCIEAVLTPLPSNTHSFSVTMVLTCLSDCMSVHCCKSSVVNDTSSLMKEGKRFSGKNHVQLKLHSPVQMKKHIPSSTSLRNLLPPFPMANDKHGQQEDEASSPSRINKSSLPRSPPGTRPPRMPTPPPLPIGARPPDPTTFAQLPHVCIPSRPFEGWSHDLS